MRNTIKNVTIVVPVLITSCHVSEKLKSGPKMSQTSTVAQANKKAGVLPVQQVVQCHYDPSYARSSRRDERPKLATIVLSSLDETSQGNAAREILAVIDRNHTNFIA